MRFGASKREFWKLKRDHNKKVQAGMHPPNDNDNVKMYKKLSTNTAHKKPVKLCGFIGRATAAMVILFKLLLDISAFMQETIALTRHHTPMMVK